MFTDTESAQAQVHMVELRHEADHRRYARAAGWSAVAVGFGTLLYRMRRALRR